MGKIHRTAQGRQLDMESLRLQNELVPALGNMRVNARGDQLGPGGKIIKTREMIMDEYYRAKPSPNENIPTSSSIPMRSPNRRPSQPLPTSNKQIASTEFKAAEATPDEIVDNITNQEPETELKGGLAAAVARTKNMEKKVKRVDK